MAKIFKYRSVKKTRGTEIVGSSQVNEGTGGSGGSSGGSTTLNSTLGQLLNVASSVDQQTESKVLKYNPTKEIWEAQDDSQTTTIGGLTNVESSADNAIEGQILVVNNNGNYEPQNTAYKTTLGTLDNVDPIADNPNVGTGFAVLGTDNNGASYKTFYFRRQSSR